MKELVFLQNKQALTTSLKVAEDFEKPHKDILEKIRFLAAEISATKLEVNYNPQFWEQTYTDTRGKTYPMFLMNRDGFTELVGNLNGKKAREWKRKYFAAFNAMERALLNQQNEEWRAIRQAGKRGNKEMRAVIQQALLPLAREQGYDKPEKFLYINYNNAINRAAKIQPHSRDELSLGQLYEIEKLQSMVEVSIRGLAARGDSYKQIYKGTNQTLENYSRLSLIAERFLPA